MLYPSKLRYKYAHFCQKTAGQPITKLRIVSPLRYGENVDGLMQEIDGCKVTISKLEQDLVTRKEREATLETSLNAMTAQKNEFEMRYLESFGDITGLREQIEKDAQVLAPSSLRPRCLSVLSLIARLSRN